MLPARAMRRRKRMRHCSNVHGRVCRISTLRVSASNLANTDYVKIAAMKFRWNGFKLYPLRRVVLIAITNAYAGKPQPQLRLRLVTIPIAVERAGSAKAETSRN